MEDGIYFGLDQAEYHKLERFSGSGAQNMMVSPATFWADSWMSREEEDDEEPEEATKAQILGTAYHMARLEPAIFGQTYYRGLRLKDYPHVLTTHTQIKAAMVELGIKAASGELVMDSALRLRDAGYPGPIKHLLEFEIRAGKEDWQIELPWKIYDQLIADMQAMGANEQIMQLLATGQSEVSILWTDDKGVKWKARLDRLAVGRIVDFKTFDNSRGKVLEQCLYDAVQYNRYYLQAYVYWTAAELIRAGKLKIMKLQNEAQRDLIKAIKASEDAFEYWWVWQEKSGVPNVLARRLRMTEEAHPSHLYQAPDEKSRKALADKLRRPSRIWDKAKYEVKAARDMLLQCLEIWPEGPWGALQPVEDMIDEGFNQHWLEG